MPLYRERGQGMGKRRVEVNVEVSVGVPKRDDRVRSGGPPPN